MSSVAFTEGSGARRRRPALRSVAAGLADTVGARHVARARFVARGAAYRMADRRACRRPVGAGTAAVGASARHAVRTVPITAQAEMLRRIRDVLPDDSMLVEVTMSSAAAIGVREACSPGLPAGSAAGQVAEHVPPAARPAGALHLLTTEALYDLARSVDCAAIVCGSRGAREKVRHVVDAIADARSVDSGALANARLVTSHAALLIGPNRRYRMRRTGPSETGVPREEARA